MTENIGGPGFEIVRPRDRFPWTEIDDLLPKADDFWHSLQFYCVPECCGLGAYELDPAFVRWAAHLTDDPPADTPRAWRSETPIDAEALAQALQAAAHSVRALEAEEVSASLFNEIMSADGYAELLAGIAVALGQPDSR